MEIDYRDGNWIEKAEFDGDPYKMVLFSPTCYNCVHYVGHERCAPVCKAFSKGIPPEIWIGKNRHRAPYPGDNGIRYASVNMENE